jgi:hypothetical protein
MSPPGCFPDWVGFRFGDRAALQPARKHPDRLGDRLYPDLEQEYTSLDGGYRRGLGLRHLSHEARLPGPVRAGQGLWSRRGYSEVPSLRFARPCPRPEQEGHAECMPGGLLTDLYELNMAVSYLRRGMTGPATFNLFVRRLPQTAGS